jgi:hypothetical protein
MAASFVNALQRGPKALLSWRHEEEEKALCLRAEGLKVEAGEARKQAQVLAQAVDLHQTRPALSLREWEALWGLHVLLRRNGFPRRLVYTRAEFYEAAGAKVSYRRGRRDFLSSDREDLDKAIQSLFERELVIYCHDEKRCGEIHFHILIDRGELREQGQSRANDRCFVTFHEIALEMIREQFVDLPPSLSECPLSRK